MLELGQFPLFFLLVLPVLLIVLFSDKIFYHKKPSPSQSSSSHLPKSYPIIGSFFALHKHQDQLLIWVSDVLKASPTSTFILHKPLGNRQVFTANPTNVEHILKTQFPNYPKGSVFSSVLEDLLGHGIFNVDGHEWKFQRQIASHEFNTKSLRKFIENVVDIELSDRLIPILSDSAKNCAVLDLQDILKRFATDNICKIAFGYDPAWLSPSLPGAQFAASFEEAVQISSQRLRAIFPFVWKIKRFLNIGSERNLRKAVSVRQNR